MKLTLRFVLLVLVLLLSFGAGAASGLQALTKLDDALNGVVKGDMERLLAITHARRLFRSMTVLERDYLLAASTEERAGVDKKMTSNARELLEQIDKYASLMHPEDAAAVASIRGARARWIERDEKVRSAARAGLDAKPLAALHAADPVSWEAVIGALVKANERRLAEQVKATHAVYTAKRTMLLSVSALACLFAAGFGYVVFVGIRSNMNEVLALNTNLEALVAARTEALSAREQSLRLVLDSTGDGIVGISAKGTIVGECSAAAERWFGKPKPEQRCAEYLYASDPKRQLAFSMALEQLLEDVLPWELLVAQMPHRVARDGLLIELSYKQIVGDENGLSVLLVMRDVTARVRSEEAERDLREEQGLVKQLLADKQGFALFVSEIEALLQALENETDARVLRRHLHTLKGNVAIFGLDSMAQRCHEIETGLEDADSLPSTTDLTGLSVLFRGKLKGIEPFLTGAARGTHEVASDDFGALVHSLQNREDYQEILKMVELWSWQRTSERLARLRAETEYVAQRLGKAVRIEVAHGNLRTPPGYLDRFWPTLVHAVRNAVDHGVESESERADAGKPSEGVVRLSTRQTPESFFIEVADDGRGIDLQVLQRSAEERGLRSLSNANLVDLVFADGVSSRAEVTELSGRGVGLAATRAACEAELGAVHVETQVGSGTRLVFEFRRPLVRTDRADGRARRWSLVPLAAS
jgi:HPt (histidine-containing phosphotransfer) domain-containing protein/PAS domain-containing protein